jgi:hypothetical protein
MLNLKQLFLIKLKSKKSFNKNFKNAFEFNKFYAFS